MDVAEVVTLEDLKRFLETHRIAMTMHIAHGQISVTLTAHGGGQPFTGKGATIEAALTAAWGQRS